MKNELADLALRLFYTTARSTPSERAFAFQNLLPRLHQNRLDAEQSKQVTFISLNTRALRSATEEDENEDDEEERLTAEDNLISNWWSASRMLKQYQEPSEID